MQKAVGQFKFYYSVKAGKEVRISHMQTCMLTLESSSEGKLIRSADRRLNTAVRRSAAHPTKATQAAQSEGACASP